MFKHDKHPAFLNVPERTAKVWRYMDLARLLSLLETSSIWLSQTATMADPWEGYINYPKDYEHRPGPYIIESMRNETYINCWHESEYESAAMWDIYQREGRGVALQTTWGALTDSLVAPFGIYGARVNYIDYRTTVIDPSNVLHAVMTKRISFAHEKECRLVVWNLAEPELVQYEDVKVQGPLHKGLTEEDREIRSRRLSEENPLGYAARVNLDHLISAIYVAPDATPWFTKLVEQLVARYQIRCPVIQSDLNVGPVY